MSIYKEAKLLEKEKTFLADTEYAMRKKIKINKFKVDSNGDILYINDVKLEPFGRTRYKIGLTAQDIGYAKKVTIEFYANVEMELHRDDKLLNSIDY